MFVLIALKDGASIATPTTDFDTTSAIEADEQVDSKLSTPGPYTSVLSSQKVSLFRTSHTSLTFPHIGIHIAAFVCHSDICFTGG